MKFLRLSILCLLSVALFSCQKDKEPTPQPQPEPTPPVHQWASQDGSGETDGYKIVWQDLFDDADTLNLNYWNIEFNGQGGGNNELQYYTPQNVTIEVDTLANRKCLVLTAKKEEFYSKHCTSGRVNTQGKVAYTHGKVEALIKFPKTYKGLWPAFWMMGNDYKKVGWPKCGELDIIEMGNSGGLQLESKAEKYLNGACHWGPVWSSHYSYGYSKTYYYSMQDDNYHLLTLFWDEKSIKCYIDLPTYPTVDPYFEMDIEKVDPDNNKVPGNYFHKDFFILLNLAVGGDFTGKHEIEEITAFNEGNNYQAKMYIDYVKFYQKTE